jgi:hypothetical protein
VFGLLTTAQKCYCAGLCTGNSQVKFSGKFKLKKTSWNKNLEAYYQCVMMQKSKIKYERIKRKNKHDRAESNFRS